MSWPPRRGPRAWQRAGWHAPVGLTGAKPWRPWRPAWRTPRLGSSPPTPRTWRGRARPAPRRRRGLDSAGLPRAWLYLGRDPSRESVTRLLRLTGLVDAVIPRGGASLIRHVVEHARVPVIETGAGVCHTYVDTSAEAAMALE